MKFGKVPVSISRDALTSSGTQKKSEKSYMTKTYALERQNYDQMHITSLIIPISIPTPEFIIHAYVYELTHLYK